MREREVRRRLSRAISNSVPDVLDDILEKCEKKRGFDFKMAQSRTSKNEKKVLFPKYAMVGAVLVCIVFLGFGITKYNNVNSVESVIAFDVNPSIEIKVNKDEKVVEVNSLNEDGKKVLKDMELKKVDLDVAVNAIIGSMLKNGYLSVNKNSILVSVDNNNEKESTRLQNEISSEIDKILKNSSIEGNVLVQKYGEDSELKELAKKYNITISKAKLIKSVIDANLTNHKNELYIFEDLVDLSINELNVLVESKKVEVVNVTSTGTASQNGYIGKDKAKSIAFKAAGAKESKIKKLEVEFDADNGRLTYEIDFMYNNKEYEYDIDAVSGKIIHKEIDIDEDTNKSSSHTKTYIGKDLVKTLVFKDAGVTADKVRELEIEFDKDNKTYVYEVEFKAGNKEYSYEVNAKSGKILDKEVETED